MAMAIQKRLVYFLHKKFLPFWPLSEHLSSLPSTLCFTLDQADNATGSHVPTAIHEGP